MPEIRRPIQSTFRRNAQRRAHDIELPPEESMEPLAGAANLPSSAAWWTRRSMWMVAALTRRRLCRASASSCAASPGPWRGSDCFAPRIGSCCRRPRSSSSTSWRWRTRSSPTSGQSSSATATPCSSCSARRRYLDDDGDCRVRRAATSSPGPNFVLTVRHGNARQTSAAVRQPHGGRSRAARPGSRRPSSTRSSTAVVDGYAPVVAGAPERPRRDRDPGLPRSTLRRLAAHLRACPGEVIELPASHPAAPWTSSDGLASGVGEVP